MLGLDSSGLLARGDKLKHRLRFRRCFCSRSRHLLTIGGSSLTAVAASAVVAIPWPDHNVRAVEIVVGAAAARQLAGNLRRRLFLLLELN